MTVLDAEDGLIGDIPAWPRPKQVAFWTQAGRWLVEGDGTDYILMSDGYMIVRLPRAGVMLDFTHRELPRLPDPGQTMERGVLMEKRHGRLRQTLDTHLAAAAIPLVMTQASFDDEVHGVRLPGRLFVGERGRYELLDQRFVDIAVDAGAVDWAGPADGGSGVIGLEYGGQAVADIMPIGGWAREAPERLIAQLRKAGVL